MLSNISALNEMASEFGVDKDRLLKDALKTYIQNAISELEQFENKIKSMYLCSSPKGLKDKIANGEMPEHPSWEDYLTWKNIERSIENFKRILRWIINRM
ncbi:MAG: hypothetical protein WBD09_09845 [Halobacteriota archaeon]